MKILHHWDGPSWISSITWNLCICGQASPFSQICFFFARKLPCRCSLCMAGFWIPPLQQLRTTEVLARKVGIVTDLLGAFRNISMVRFSLIADQQPKKPNTAMYYINYYIRCMITGCWWSKKPIEQYVPSKLNHLHKDWELWFPLDTCYHLPPFREALVLAGYAFGAGVLRISPSNSCHFSRKCAWRPATFNRFPPASSKWPFDHPNEGHLTPEKVT